MTTIYLRKPYVRGTIDTSYSPMRIDHQLTTDSHHLHIEAMALADFEVEFDQVDSIDIGDNAELLGLLTAITEAKNTPAYVKAALRPAIGGLRDEQADRLTRWAEDSGFRWGVEQAMEDLDPEAWTDEAEARRALRRFAPTARKILIHLATEEPALLVTTHQIAADLELDGGARAVAAAIGQGFTATCAELGKPVPVAMSRDPHEDTDVRYVFVPHEYAPTFAAAARGIVEPLTPSSPDWEARVVPVLFDVLIERARASQPFRSSKTFRQFELTAQELQARIDGLRINYRRDIPQLLAVLQRILHDIDPSLPWITTLVQTGRGAPAATIHDLADELGVNLGDRDFIGSDDTRRLEDDHFIEDLRDRIEASLAR